MAHLSSFSSLSFAFSAAFFYFLLLLSSTPGSAQMGIPSLDGMHELEGQGPWVMTSRSNGLDLQAWKQRLQEIDKAIPPYPADTFKGKGIVMAAGRRKYFTTGYLLVRALRDYVKTKLPIEWMYAGEDELSQTVVDYIQSKFENVKMVDLTKIPELRGVNLRGYQIKAFSIFYSSFQEVLWLDSDNFPIKRPDFLFSSSSYTEHGALFWPDYCNMISMREETYEVFGLPKPSFHIQPREGKQTIWPSKCHTNQLIEVETGQIVLDKARVWRALFITNIINMNSDFFLKKLFHGDKMTFWFAFRFTKTAFNIVGHAPGSLGLGHQPGSTGKVTYCGNTMIQKNPDSGNALFFHRNAAKFHDSSSYLLKDEVPRAWVYIAEQGPKDGWDIVFQGELPQEVFVGSSSDAIQTECLTPNGKYTVKKAADVVVAYENALLGYLKDLSVLPFYPGDRSCAGEKLYFCKHP